MNPTVLSLSVSCLVKAELEIRITKQAAKISWPQCGGGKTARAQTRAEMVVVVWGCQVSRARRCCCAPIQSHYREVPRWEIFMEQKLRFGLYLGQMADFPAFIASTSFDL